MEELKKIVFGYESNMIASFMEILYPHTEREVRPKIENQQRLCTICANWYGYQYYCQHIEKQHGNYLCDKCGIVIQKECKFRKHMNNHKKEGNKICPGCEIQFSCVSVLRRHIQQNHPEKILKCTGCDFYETWDKHYLVMHMTRFHRNYIPILCGDCNRRFWTVKRLVRHRCHFKPKVNMLLWIDVFML